ncbi:14431_t:CDS:2, partial [Ambispora leptoticha]
FQPNFSNSTLNQVTSGVSPQSLPANQNIIFYDTANAGIELVFVNNIHSFHLHGHSFYVVERGNGTTPDSSAYNLVNPPYRDTVTIPPTG